MYAFRDATVRVKITIRLMKQKVETGKLKPACSSGLNIKVLKIRIPICNNSKILSYRRRNHKFVNRSTVCGELVHLHFFVKIINEKKYHPHIISDF